MKSPAIERAVESLHRTLIGKEGYVAVGTGIHENKRAIFLYVLSQRYVDRCKLTRCRGYPVIVKSTGAMRAV
jgi:hypothetical protein